MFDEGHGLQETLIAFGPLHGSNLKDSTSLLHDLFDEFAFIDGQGQGFFAVDVLTGQHGFDGDFRVPVIGGGDHDGIDVFAIENPAVITVAIGAFFLSFFEALQIGFKDCGIHIGEGGEIGKLGGFAGDGYTLIPQSDGGKHRPVAGRTVAGSAEC